MYINHIENIRNKFESFSESLEGVNYVVGINCKKFNYSGGVDFSIKNLRELYPEADFNIDGDITISSFQEVLDDMKNALSYFSDDRKNLILNKQEKQTIINKRVKNFWNIMGDNFLIPPKIVYKHIPADGSYFADCVMWTLCYVFLNEKEGLVFDGSSSD